MCMHNSCFLFSLSLSPSLSLPSSLSLSLSLYLPLEAKFGGHVFFGFGDFAPFLFAFKMTKISLQTMDYSPWGSKNRIG